MMSDQIDAIFANMDKAGASTKQDALAAPVSKHVDALDAMFSNMDRANNVVATQNLIAAQGADPDKAAKAAALSRENGVPQPAVESDLAGYQQQSALKQNVDAIDQHPNLAAFVASNPLAARMAQDDFAKLGFLEKTWDAIKSGSQGAVEQNAMGRLGNVKQAAGATGGVTPLIDQQIQALGTRIQGHPSLDGGFGFLQKFSGFAGGLIDNAIAAVPYAAGGAGGGALAGSAAGGIGAVPGAMAGGTIGMGVGFNADMARVAAGNAYLKMDTMRGADGQSMSEPAKQFGALFTGAATYAVGTYATAVESKLFGQTAESLAARAIDQAMTRPTFVNAMAQFTKGVATGASQGAGIMTAMEGSSIIGEEIAKAISPGHFDTSAQEIVDRLEEAAINGAVMVGAMHGAMGGMALYGDFRAARRADSNAAMFKSLMVGSTESKLRERDQQAFKEFMQNQTDGTTVENLYIPAEKVREFYQSMGVDHTISDRTQDPLFGFVNDMPTQLREAEATGGDVVIPSADFLTHLAGTPIADKMLPDLRVGANAMSINDAKIFNDEYQIRLKAAADVAAATTEEVKSPTQAIFDDIKAQAMDAGHSEASARQHAAIYASRYAARAERLGVDPMEAYKLSGVDIKKTEAKQSGDDKTFNQSGKPTAEGKTDFEIGKQQAIDKFSSFGGYEYDGKELTKDGEKIADLKLRVDGNRLVIDDIVANKKGEGKGTDAIKAIIAHAQDQGLIPALITDAMRGKAQQKALRAYYERLGFIANKGTNKIKGLKEEYYLHSVKDLGSTQSPKFKKWFGDSKIVDANGNPLLVFHGTSGDHTEFSDNYAGSVSSGAGKGFWFSKSKEYAWEYAENAAGKRSGEPDIRRVYLYVKNPLRVEFNDYGKATVGGKEMDWSNNNNAIEYAKQHGYDGIDWITGSFTDDPSITVFKSEQIKSANSNNGNYDSENKNIYEQPTRGSISFGDGKALISLFKNADQSTLIHETGHLWLDELTQDAGIEGAPDQIKDDLQTAMKWMGVENYDQIGESQHEQFARAVEAYFMEGKAPSRELAGVFSRFKAWLTKIYSNIKNLNTPINDEIRGVFDRLLATDAQIEDAKHQQGLTPAFKSKEEAGMTTAEWKSYTGAIDRANQRAESELMDKMMAKVRRERTKEYKEALSGAKEHAAGIVDQRQDIQALNLLTKGKMPDGTEEPGAKLSRGDIEAVYGKKGLTDLPKGVTAIDGVHPDHVAEMLGMASGDELVKSLQALEQQQREIRMQDGEKRSVRQYLIDQEANAWMDARHGDIMDEQSMRDEALGAIHSDKQEELLATELRYIQRMGAQSLVERGAGRRAVKEVETKADWDAAEADLINQIKAAKTQAEIDKLNQKLADLNRTNRLNNAERNTTQAALRQATVVTKPMLDAVRAHVATLLESKTTEEIGNFNKYLRDERKSAREVQQAIIKKDWNAAAAAKQRQIMANILYVKAKEASGKIDKGTALMTGMAKRKSFSGISQEYTNQIHDLIGRFGFDSGRGEELQRTKAGTLEDFVKDKSANEGIELAVDVSLFNTAGGPVEKMSLSEFRALELAVRSMREVGQSDKIIMVDGEKREFNAVINQVVDSIRALPERPKSDYMNPKSMPFMDRTKSSITAAGRATDALLVKMEELFSQLDSRDPHGILSMSIFKRMKDAEHNRNLWSDQSAKDFKAAADAAPAGWIKRLRDILPEDATIRDPETGRPMKIARKDMLGMMLNWGNDGNKTRLADGYKWDQQHVKSFLDRNATKADWDFVQAIWNAYDKYKDPLDKLQQRVTGVGMELVHAEAVDTPFGRYDGGYYPIVEDKSRSYRAETHAEKNAQAMFPNGFQRATTPHGNTITRVGGKNPISIDMDIAPWKIGQTIHDLAMREAIMDADRILGNVNVKKALDDVMGPEYRKLMRPWLQTVANSRNIDDAAMGTWNRILSTARTNVVIVGIGFRAMTMAKHGTTALSNSIGELGAKWMMAGTKEFFGPGMSEKWEFIKSKSPDMAYRLTHYDQDVNSQYANQFKDSAYTKFQQQAQHFGHIGISYLDLGSAAPTWLGAYRKGLAENMNDSDAVYYADQTVRNAHGGTGITDRSAIQTQKGVMQLFTMFYGFFNHIYNRQRLLAIDASHGVANVKAGEYKQASKDFGHVLARSFFYVAMPALIEAMAHGGPNEDKEETWAGWGAKAILSEIPAGVPIMRDIAKAVIEGRNYEMSPVGRAVDVIVQSTHDIHATIVDGEAPEHMAQHSAEAAGYLTGLPTAAPFTAGKFLWDYSNGTVDPQSLAEWIQGLLHGKIKDK